MVPMTAADVVGAPCWLSLMARDLRAAQDFYGAVLGWTFREDGFGQAYSVAELGGVPVAGIGAVAGEFAVPVAWTPYFAVADADATVARIRDRGGTVGVGPVSYRSGGRAALATDREGASFGIWEGRIVSEWRVGDGEAPAWLELRTGNAFDAAVFYGEVLEWASGRAGCCEVSYEDDRVVLRHGGQAVARLNSGPVDGAAGEPRLRPRWVVHFKVPSLEAARDAAVEHGGRTVPDGAGQGGARECTMRDPEGGLFTLDQWPVEG